MSAIRIQDIADILILSFLLYQLYSWFRRTRAIQVVFGLGMVMLIYFATRFFGLYMTSWVLQELGTVLIVLIIVVFQAEIRQALYRFSRLRNFFENHNAGQTLRLQEIAETIFTLAAARTGAIIVFQREESLVDLMHNGVPLDCEITPQIISSIFSDSTPLHDGAVLIRDGRIAYASCHLPLSISPDIPQYLGTRHRAALGLAERTDAVVVVSSEERGVVSLALGGELTELSTPGALIASLQSLLLPEPPKPAFSIQQRLFSNLLPKAAILLTVTVFWALVTTRQGQITTVSVPVRFHKMPDGLMLVKSAPEEVEIQLKSLSRLMPPNNRMDIAATIDLSSVHEGQNTIRVTTDDLQVPTGMTVNSVSPASIRVVMERKIHRVIPVRVHVIGKLSVKYREYEPAAEPSGISVEGPSNHVAKLEFLSTENIAASDLSPEHSVRVPLLPLPPMLNPGEGVASTVNVILARKKQKY